MRIGLVSGGTYACPPRAYGSEVTTWYLARELAALGHEVHLFGPGGSVAPDGVELHYVRGSYAGIRLEAEDDPWEWYGPLLRSCDVVHDCSPSCLTYERAYVQWPQARLLATRNGIDFASPRLPSPARNIVVLSHAAREAALSGTSAWAGTPYAETLDLYPGALRDARVVYYGTDTDWYSPGDRPPERFILYVGRPHPAKGVGRLIEAARRLAAHFFVLAWRAAAPDHEEWERRYREQARYLPNVSFVRLPELGHHEAKRDLYRRAAAMVTLPVYTEAFGLTTIEALACGCPVVSTRRGAAPEILRHGRTGYLVPSEEDEQEELDAALAGVGTLSRESCRADAEELWSARRMATDYLRLYEELAAGGGWG
jgi:glycosyltransferase involved in cell wall biosynthesis